MDETKALNILGAVAEETGELRPLTKHLNTHDQLTLSDEQLRAVLPPLLDSAPKTLDPETYMLALRGPQSPQLHNRIVKGLEEISTEIEYDEWLFLWRFDE